MKHKNVGREKLILVWPLFTGEAKSGKPERVWLQWLHQRPRGPVANAFSDTETQSGSLPLHTRQSLCLGLKGMWKA